ncbi:MAG: hypothetical protein JO301_04875 [Chitinophagaceae bacterium]|nr:hypothetical protein [Chitinophagaceae bacterium]
MRKISVALLVFLLAGAGISRAHAQLIGLPKVLAFGNLTYASPVGANFSNIANHGFGYEAGAGIGLGKTMLVASAGQITYNLTNNGRLTVNPLKLGIRRYLLLGLFLNASLGTALQHTDVFPDKKGNFLYEVGGGFKFGFVELGAAYTSYKLAYFSGNASSLLFKAGVAVKL